MAVAGQRPIGFALPPIADIVFRETETKPEEPKISIDPRRDAYAALPPLAAACIPSESPGFDPMSGAIVFSDGTLKVHVEKCPAFVMNNESFGPYENKDVELPKYAALYLVLKRYALLK